MISSFAARVQVTRCAAASAAELDERGVADEVEHRLGDLGEASLRDSRCAPSRLAFPTPTHATAAHPLATLEGPCGRRPTCWPWRRTTAVAHAARALAVPSSWSDLGSDDVGVWGLYRGTSAEPYDVAVDRSGPAWRCSCPSRKLPCKHAVGLLLLWAEGSVPTTVRPAAVSSWLAARAAAAARDAAEAGTTVAAGDVEGSPAGRGRPSPSAGSASVPDRARQRRADERAARVRGGLDELDRWLADQIRRGLASPEATARDAWEAAATRLVDAQAGALANRVRRATELLATQQ